MPLDRNLFNRFLCFAGSKMLYASPLPIDLVNRTGRPHELPPTPTDVSVVLRAAAQIGEGPVWDARTQRLTGSTSSASS